MSTSLPNRQRLTSIRFQETDQQPYEAAKAIVDFLRPGPGRVVDTSETPDDTRELLVLGYVIDRHASGRSSNGPAV